MKNVIPRGGAPTSLRLTFIYDDEQFRLEKLQRVRMRSPGGEQGEHQGEDAPEPVGSWVEVRGEQDRPLYRCRLHRLVVDDVELHEGGEEGGFRRFRRGEISGRLSVVVPDLEEGRTVLLLERRAAEAPDEEPETRTFAEVPLDDIDGEPIQSPGRT